MQVHKPKPLPRDLREFAREYAMIVSSILTAIALDHLVVDWLNHQAAIESRARILAELQRNYADLQTSQQKTAADTAKVQALTRQLPVSLWYSKPPDPALEAGLDEISHGFGVSVPTWQRSAWDAAIADQSAGHLRPAELSQFAHVYAEAADVERPAQLLLGGDWINDAAALGVAISLHQLDERKRAELLVRHLIAAL